MAVSDGLQSAGSITVTTSAGIAVSFGNKMTNIFLRNDGAGAACIDITGGASVVATTSAGFNLKSSETLTIAPAGPGRFYTGFSAIVSGTTTAGLRFIAWR